MKKQTFKERVRKALFAFFHDEVMAEVGPLAQKEIEKILPMPKFSSPPNIHVKELKFKILIQDNKDVKFHEDLTAVMQRRINEANDAIFKEFKKFVTVDTQTLLGRHADREITLTVFVGRDTRNDSML